MNSLDFFRLNRTDIMCIEESCLARITPRQGGEGAVSGILPAGDCDPGRAASCNFGIIGATSCCPCSFCGGIARVGGFS